MAVHGNREQYCLLLHLQRDEERRLDLVFFSSNFFKQMVNLGISDIKPKIYSTFAFRTPHHRSLAGRIFYLQHADYQTP